MCGWNRVYFSGLQVYEWVSFSLQKYINGVSFFYQKCIWMGKIWKKKSIWMCTIFAMGYIWMGIFLASSSIWMEWGPETPVAHPYPKSWQVTPPPPPDPSNYSTLSRGSGRYSTVESFTSNYDRVCFSCMSMMRVCSYHGLTYIHYFFQSTQRLKYTLT